MCICHRFVLRRPQVGKKRCHLVKRSSSNSLVVPVAGQVLADFLLVVPEQAVQGQHVAVADERQAVVDSVAGRAVGRDVQEKPSRRVKIALHKVIERPHVLLFRKQHVVGNALKDLKGETWQGHTEVYCITATVIDTNISASEVKLAETVYFHLLSQVSQQKASE